MARPHGETHAEVTLSYDGPAVQSGSMDVHELAPALLAMGDLFQAANRVANGDLALLSVRVQAQTRSGSFPIDLGLVQVVANIISGIDLKDAGEIAKIVLGSGGLLGLFQLLKKLKGQKPEKAVSAADGQVALEVKDSPGAHVTVSFTVSKDVYALYADPHARIAAERAVKPLDAPGIDRLDVVAGGRVIETIRDEDLPAFKAPQEPVALEPVADSTYIAAFKIVKPAFEKGLRWSLSDGKRRWGVEIEDKRFLERLDRGERFGKGDVLKVKVEQKSTRSPDGDFNTTLRVLEVLDHIRSTGIQASLLPPPGDNRGDE